MEPKVSFGLSQINCPTPAFATWLFRGYFIVSKAVIGWLMALSANHIQPVTPHLLLVITLTVTLLLDPIALGVSKMWGICVPEADQSTNPPASEKTDGPAS